MFVVSVIPGSRHLLQPNSPLNFMQFSTKHFAGKSQVPANKITLEINELHIGGFTSTPCCSNALNSLTVGFK